MIITIIAGIAASTITKWLMWAFERMEKRKEKKMKLTNAEGQSVYYNIVTKHGLERHVILAASGQKITGRDKQRTRSRTFAQGHQAEAWLQRNGYR